MTVEIGGVVRSNAEMSERLPAVLGQLYSIEALRIPYWGIVDTYFEFAYVRALADDTDPWWWSDVAEYGFESCVKVLDRDAPEGVYFGDNDGLLGYWSEV